MLTVNFMRSICNRYEKFLVNAKIAVCSLNLCLCVIGKIYDHSRQVKNVNKKFSNVKKKIATLCNIYRCV